MFKIVLFLFTFLHIHIEAHIRLTFPPGRKFAVDFLDNQRTYGPCGGMPQGDIKTRLTAGKSYTFSWHMGLLHQGNFQIELFNSAGKLSDFATYDETKTAPTITQTRLIEIPLNLTCANCTIRLLREATEFSAPGNPYIFWSCADVDIVPPNSNYGLSGDREDCSGNGKPSYFGKCFCDEGYTGKYCELDTECVNHSDCGAHGRGKCLKLSQIDEHVVGQCFCEFPYFGQKCSNGVKSGVQTLQKFQADLQTNLKEYRKIDLLADQVTLYYKIIKDSDSGNEPQIEFVLKSKSTSFIGLGWRPSETTRDCKRHWPKLGQLIIRRARGLEEVFLAEVAESRKHSAHLSQSPNLFKTHEFPQAPFSAMDCTDIVLSSVRGNHSRIRDYYTMDRSTPQPDAFWGGEDNILFATGWESLSETTVVFRKPISSSESVDHSLSGELHLIWSKGQTFSDNTNPIYSRFYAQDEIKYHGYGSNQRGVLKTRFL